jgi:predicted MFS family arabinose efflux permease
VPQVLALIHLRLIGQARERAVGAYSAVLALGVASGQIVGGLLVTVDLGGLSWRSAFLVNVPIGLVLLAAAPRHLPSGRDRDDEQRLDLAGVLTLSAAMVAVVLPLVVGREFGWPAWSWAALVAAGSVLLATFAGHERRASGRTAALIDPGVLATPGVPAGLTACFVVMGCYAAFLFALTLRLQDGLGFTALAAGVAFVPYATGFALCSLGAPRLAPRYAARLPVAGPLALAGAAVVVALTSRDGWAWVWCSALLLLAGAGHAAAFSPLVARMSAGIPAPAAASLSALVSTGALLANVLGVAGIGAVYLALVDQPKYGSGTALAATAASMALLLVIGAFAAIRAQRALGRLVPEADGR